MKSKYEQYANLDFEVTGHWENYTWHAFLEYAADINMTFYHEKFNTKPV